MSLFHQVIEATTVAEVTNLIIAVQTGRRTAWLPIGSNENNLATINLGSDPAAGLIERVTNAFDAVLDLEWVQRGQPTSLMSPRAATEQWFGIPNGRLSKIEDIRETAVVALTDRVQITLQDSERDDRPTVDIRDYGIGIKAGEFATSILSLHKSRKLRKLFLAGAFGQGGSTALAYSPLTVIVSRPAPLLNDTSQHSGEIGFTIVRFNEGDTLTDKHGLYEYLVDHATGHPVTLPASVDFEPGTLVRHVSMDLGKYKNVLTAPTGSLWFLAHNYLFDPVLPFRLIENRTNKAAAQRTAAGNFRLLTRGENTEYQRSAALTFRSGLVSLTWWVLSPEGDQARNRLTQYVMASKPIVVTYNGQKQGDFPNTIVKNELKLPYLERYLIVHVDCDRLDNEARRQLFPTTRESVRDTVIGDDLKRLIVDTLAGDAELQRLDDERKRRYLQRADSAAIENIRRRLGSRVKAVLRSAAGGAGPRVLPPEPRDPADPQPAIPVQEPPTFLEIVSPEPRKVYAGKRFIIRFRTDADPAYFLNPDKFIAIIDPPSFGQYTGTTNVRDGYGVAYFTAVEGLEVGVEAKITLEVRPRRAQSLRACLTVEVVALPTSANASDSGQVATPNVNPQWINEGDAFWVESSWNRQSVAKVVPSQDSIEIFVSAHNDKLSSLVARAQRRSIEAVDSVKDFHLEHVAFHAFMESIAQVDVPIVADEDAEPSRRGEQNQELARVCDTVCGIADALFELIATGVIESGPADVIPEADHAA